MGLERIKYTCYVHYKHYQVICVMLRVKIAAVCQSFKVKELVLVQQKASLVLLNGVLMLTTKGQNKQ